MYRSFNLQPRAIHKSNIPEVGVTCGPGTIVAVQRQEMITGYYWPPPPEMELIR